MMKKCIVIFKYEWYNDIKELYVKEDAYGRNK